MYAASALKCLKITHSISRRALFPFALGLLGFIEPCSIGASLLFLKYVEGREAVERVAQTVLFTLTRATFMGGLGAMAALIGATVFGIQKAGWLFLGAVYVAIGVMYATGKAASLKRRMGPRLDRLSGTRGAIGLAVLFGLWSLYFGLFVSPKP